MARYDFQYKGKGYSINEAEQVIFENERPLNVPSMPFKILLYLAANAQKWRSWQQIRGAVWQGTNVGKGNVHTQINAVRKIFADKADDPEGLIETWGPRYRFSIMPRTSREDGDEGKPSIASCSSVGLSISHAVKRLIEDYDIQIEGRKPQLDQLDNFLSDTSKSVLFLTSGTGTGKTALLTAWVRKLKNRAGVNVVFYPINQIYETDSSEDTFSTLATELAALNEQTPGGIRTIHQNRNLFANLLREWRKEKLLVIVIDGLDEAVHWELNRTAFPKILPSNVKTVLSVRRTPGITSQSLLDQFGWESEQTIFMENLPPLEVDAIAALLVPLQHQKLEIVHEIQRITNGEPLHISFVLKDLKNRDISLNEIRNIPSGFDRYVGFWVDRIESGPDGKKAHTILGLISVSTGPLTYPDIYDLAPDIFESAWEVRRIVKLVARFLTGGTSPEQGLIWNHSLTAAVFTSMLSEQEKQRFNRRFIQAGESWWDSRGAFNSHYFGKYWAQHLMLTDDWQRVENVLCSFERHENTSIQPWLTFQRNHFGSYETYLRDLNSAIERASQNNNFALMFQCALIRSSVYGVLSNYSPGLLANLVIYGNIGGKWTLNAALDIIKRLRSSEKEKSKAFNLLLTNGVKFSGDNVLTVIPQVSGENSGRWPWWFQFCPYSSEDIPKLLSAARDEIWPSSRAAALAALLPSLDPPEFNKVIEEVSEALTAVNGEMSRFAIAIFFDAMVDNKIRKMISERVPWFGYVERPAKGSFPPQKQIAARAELIKSLKQGAKTGFDHFELTTEQVTQDGLWSASDLDELFAIVDDLPTSQKISALIFLARIAAPPMNDTLWMQCLQTILMQSEGISGVAETLTLIPAGILAQAWDTIAEQYSSMQLEDFEYLIPLVPDRFLDRTLHWIRSGHSEKNLSQSSRASLLSLMAEHFEGIQKCELLEEAEKLVERFDDGDEILIFVKALLPYLSGDARNRVIEASSQLSPKAEFIILPSALQYCGSRDKEILWKKILASYEKISDISQKIETIGLLVQNAPSSFQKELKTLCSDFPLDESSYHCWFHLLGYLNDSQLEELFSFCIAKKNLDGMIFILRHVDQHSRTGTIDKRWSHIVSQLFQIQPIDEFIEQVAAVAEQLPPGILQPHQMDALTLAFLESKKTGYVSLSVIANLLSGKHVNSILQSGNWDDNSEESKLLFTVIAANHFPEITIDWESLLESIENNRFTKSDLILRCGAPILPEHLIRRVFHMAIYRDIEAAEILTRRMSIEMLLNCINDARRESAPNVRWGFYWCLLPNLSKDCIGNRLPLETQKEICIQFIEDCSVIEGEQFGRRWLLSGLPKIIPWVASLVERDHFDSICLATLEIAECWP